MLESEDIIIAGVGGQGILTIAALIGAAAVEAGLRVKQSEVHGMAQRGGSVVSHLRLSRTEIHSDLIAHGTAHLVLAMEPMESLRYLVHARRDAAVVTNSGPVRNVPGYPDVEAILRRVQEWPRHVMVDAEKLAREAGNIRATNSVMLGAASPFLLLPPEAFRAQIEKFFRRKGDAVVDLNLRAFDAGRRTALGK